MRFQVFMHHYMRWFLKPRHLNLTLLNLENQEILLNLLNHHLKHGTNKIKKNQEKLRNKQHKRKYFLQKMKSLKEDSLTTNQCVSVYRKRNMNKHYSLNGELNTLNKNLIKIKINWKIQLLKIPQHQFNSLKKKLKMTKTLT